MVLVSAWSISRVVGTLLFAAVLPLVVLALGLSWFVEHPRFAGAEPDPGFHTLHVRLEQAQQSSFERLSYRDLVDMESRLPEQTWLAAHAQFLPVTLGADSSSHRLRVALVAGPLFDVLGVPLRGDIAMPSVSEGVLGGGEKRLVVSEQLALRLFGSAETALGEALQVHDLSSIPLGLQVYRIAAVVTGPFVGPWSDDPVDAWIPLSAWNNLLWPTHQFNQLLDMQIEFLGVRSQRPAADLATAINAALSEMALDRGLQVMVLPGLGPVPEQRLVLGEWSQVLRTGAAVLAIGLGLVCFSLRWLAIERGRHDDFVRAALGERAAAWWWRHLRLSITDLLLLLLAACALATLLWFIGERFLELPVREAMSSAARGSMVLGLLGVLAGVYLLPAAACGMQRRVSQSHGRSFSRYLSLMGNALLMIAAGGTAVAALIAVLTIARSDLLLNRDLGIASTRIAIAELAPVDGDTRARVMYLFDPRPVSLLLPASQGDAGYALASAAPLELPFSTTHGRVLAETTEHSGRFLLNEVSGNYFDILGIEPLWSCSPFADTPREQVWVNAAFQSQYLGGAAAGSARIELQVGAESVLHQSLVLCGVVPDFHYGNARGGAVPMIYRRMERVGGASAVIFAGADWAAEAAQFATLLAGVYPDLALSPPRLASSLIAEQLAEERGMALMAALVFVMVVALTVLLTAYVVGVAALLQFHVLAIRWAVGAHRLRLLASVLHGKNVWVYPLGVGLTTFVCLRLASAVPGGEGNVSVGLLLACLGAAVGSVLLGLLPVLYALNDEALKDRLAAKD